MNELTNVKIEYVNESFMANSRQVAGDFRKDHSYVLQEISKLKDLQGFGSMFVEGVMPDSYGREQRVFYMNRDGFSLIAMGFTGPDAMQWKVKYIEAFNLMEKELNSPEQIMARALKVADKQISSLSNRVARQEKKIEDDKPKVLFANSVSASHTSILVGDLAKLIKQNGYDIGQNRLFEYLRDNGWLISREGDSKNMPTQKGMDRGFFEIKERTVNNPDGSIRITKTPKVTGKGQIYFVNKFLGKNQMTLEVSL